MSRITDALSIGANAANNENTLLTLSLIHI